MSVYVATKTLAAMESAVSQDQGAKYREWLGKVIPHMGDAYRSDEDAHRSHLGSSQLGGECARAIWYNFRWATRSHFPGRVLRLFNRGHLEEARFIALLLTIGCEVYQQDAQGNQFRITFSEGHGGGSGDGVALHVPDLEPGTAVLLEFKTHSEKSFIDLAGPLPSWRNYLAGKGSFSGKGVRESKLEHYVQMQLYMRKMGLSAALYLAVNKNTDDIYAEIVPINQELADQFLDRGDKLIWMTSPPEKLNDSPGFYKCRFCDHKPVCHLGQAPDRNCRTCAHSAPGKNAEWHCSLHNKSLTKEEQLRACSEYKKSDVYE